MTLYDNTLNPDYFNIPVKNFPRLFSIALKAPSQANLEIARSPPLRPQHQP
ncbi:MULTISPECIES: hypothetical protein [unclassified Microcoleus]|uniref:hypothetical protein n=1 Tax=unclassified Microcoleus TaxID=2642155 RepID=UPI002FD56FE1